MYNLERPDDAFGRCKSTSRGGNRTMREGTARREPEDGHQTWKGTPTCTGHFLPPRRDGSFHRGYCGSSRRGRRAAGCRDPRHDQIAVRQAHGTGQQARLQGPAWDVLAIALDPAGGEERDPVRGELGRLLGQRGHRSKSCKTSAAPVRSCSSRIIRSSRSSA